MKCISNKSVFLLIVTMYACLLLGCGRVEYSVAYPLEEITTTYLAETLIQEQYLFSFASNLCVVSDDILIDTLDMSELAAIGLFDLSKQEVLYAENVNTILFPASLTKVMTAIIVLKHGDLDAIIEVKEPIVFNESGVVTSNIQEGDRLTVEQALHLLLISSSNDAAVILAREIGGSMEGFCQLMNDEAKSLGATNTNFVNPHGLHSDNNYTTAYDLYLMFQEALTYSKFLEISSMVSYETIGRDIEGVEKVFTASTTNQYLKGVYEVPEDITILNGKTGTTQKAGRCLIIHAKDEGESFYIGVILNAPDLPVLYGKMSEMLVECSTDIE
ncbi:MAG: serine hydrolase [Eubacteriales bacterium]